jgi:hypothetical protein
MLLGALLWNAVSLVREGPVTYMEGVKNLEARRPFEAQISPALRAELAAQLGATILMDTATSPNLVALSGFPLRQTINESDLGLFDQALRAPAEHAALVLAFDGDAIDRAVKAHPEGLKVLRRFEAPGHAPGTLYRSRFVELNAGHGTK